MQTSSNRPFTPVWRLAPSWVCLVFAATLSVPGVSGGSAHGTDAPADRHHHAMTYDPAMRRVVLFGGSRIGSDRKSEILGDLWSWDGSRWTQLAAATNAPMSGHRLFADGRGGLFLSGGRSGLTARWESGTWVRLGEDPNQSVPASAAAFDPHRNRFVVFGGAPQPGLTIDDTWEFDGQRWTLVAQSAPPSRMLAAMAYDQAQRRILLFGGRDSAKRTLGDTWSWDGQTWSRLDVHGPLPRHGHAMAYDVVRREVVMFGGTKQPRELLDETWLWNGHAWRKADGTAPRLRSGQAPPARSGAEMVFDAARGVIVLFGGASDDPVHATFGDTWEWNGRQWRLAHLGNSQTRPQTPDVSDTWPQWRGPAGQGTSPATGLPLEWGVDKNILWKAAIPGRGYSSPSVWKDHVFVTTSIEGDVVPGAAAAPHTLGGSPFVHPDSVGADRHHRLVVMALDTRTGKPLWERTAYAGTVYDARHRMGSYANTTPATDGERVYAWFGSEGLYAYDFAGTLAWKSDLGDIAAFGMGTGSSPILHRGLVILQCDDDNGEKSFIVALDARTGREVWRTKRSVQAGWSTPVIVRAGTRDELVTSGNEFVIAYDPATGRELWRAKGTGAWTVASPFAGHGIVVASASHAIKRAVAVRLGGSGDVTGTGQIAWERDRGTAYTPSGLALGDYAYLLTDAGLLTCIDIRTGEVKYEGARPPKAARVWSSLVAYGNRVFLTNEEGDTYVIKAGPTFEIERVNSLDEPIYASLAPAGGRVFIRTHSSLYAIGKEAENARERD